MNTEAFSEGSHRNSTVLRCRGCEQGSRIPTDNGISADIAHFTQNRIAQNTEYPSGVTHQLTYIQDSVPGPVPPPPLQLLMLHILQAALVKHHSHDALQTKRDGAF